jgi:tetratricopeptide (TPR) repeat protein
VNVSVYAIAKDERKFVERFMRSCCDADAVYVLDTGSSDGTAERLRELGAVVEEERVRPWRFDVARNRALARVGDDADVCVSLDLDEVLVSGWRKALERAWKPETTRARYRYRWSDALTFWYDAVHARHGYEWRQPTHEALTPLPRTAESFTAVDRLLVDHLPDGGKQRRQDLPLLRLAVAEAPGDPRAANYLARELFFHQRWRECIREVERYLALPAATWAEERSYSCRLAAACAERVGAREEAAGWLLRATVEAPNEREPWCDLAALAEREGAPALAYGAARQALSLDERSWLHFNDPDAWGVRPHLLAATSARALGQRDRAETHARAAEQIAHEQVDADPRRWHGLRQIASSAVQTGRLAAGADAAERLLSLEHVPPAVRAEATRSAALHASKLADLVHGTEFAAFEIDVAEGWSLFNPTIAPDGDGYRVVARSSNYTLHRGRYEIGGDGRVHTRSYAVRLDSGLAVTHAAEIEDRTGVEPFPYAPNCGYEDCRLFRSGDTWYATATTREHNADARCEIALLELVGSAFAALTILDEPEPGRHSKNWMPVAASPFTFVYSCAPTVVASFDAQSGSIRELISRDAPSIAQRFRGGSQVVSVDGGYLCVVHEAVEWGGPARAYVHRFVRLDDAFSITHVSRPFVFLHRGVEFCAGLAIRDGTATMSFGFRDAEAYVARAPLDGILGALAPVAGGRA